MEDEKKEKVNKFNLNNYKHLKIFGISLLFIVVMLVILVSFILLIRYSENIQRLVLNEDTQESEEEITVTVTEEENVIINVVREASPSVVSIAVSQLTLKSGEGLVDELSNIGTGFIVDPEGYNP